VIEGDTTYDIPCPTSYPVLTYSSSSGGPLYVGLTYTIGSNTGETMLGPVWEYPSGTPTGLTLSAITGLPSGVTNVNVYEGSATSVLKLTSLSVSGNATSSYTFTGAGSGAAPPTKDPAYPVSFVWGNATGMTVTNTPGLTVQNIYLGGDGTSGANSDIGIDVNNEPSITVQHSVVSNWDSCCFAAQILAHATLNDFQVDDAKVNAGVYSGVSGPGFAGGGCIVYGTNVVADQCTYGLVSDLFSGIEGGNPGTLYAGSCTTGYEAFRMSHIWMFNFASTGANTGYWNCTTNTNPTINSVNNYNSYIGTQ
jgi:hypothetical protein